MQPWVAACVMLALAGCAVASPMPHRATSRFNFQDSAPFSDSDIKTMMGYFLNNINIGGQGGVVASPDTTVPGGGSYYYHWMRDGALSMRTVWSYNNSIPNALDLMKSYVGFVTRNQMDRDPNNIDSRGEPKFLLPNGEIDPQPWCRPQNDGAAIRATTLMIFAHDLISLGYIDYVRQYLWTGSSSYNGGAIKYDLDYVTTAWYANTCDLWEEVQSTDFFWTRFNARRAMFMGAQFASMMGDVQSANRYTQAGNNIGFMDYHYNGQFVYESTNRQKDAAVIIAFNKGYNNDGIYSPLDGRVASTITTFSQLFNSTFPINGQDSNRGIPGILYGRYEGDTYSGGNPWILITGSLAELYYRSAAAAAASKSLPSKEFMEHLEAQMQMHGLRGDLTTPLGVASALTDLGDGVLTRIRYHTIGAGLHLWEQLDKYTGYEASAYDLTWSYSSVLDALTARASIADAAGVARYADM